MIGKQSKFFWIKLSINIAGLAVMAIPWITGMPVTEYPVFIAAGGGFVVLARVAIMVIEARAKGKSSE
ncbi:MAG: hypothetical protein HPY53_16205 [Brevinematales bacterium]|nr:hypothetical protein [Brevinematales bacterium]